MKFKVGLIFFAIIIIAVAFFVFQNSGDIQLNLYPGHSIHMPLSILIIASIIVGAFIMFLISLSIELKLRFKSRKIEKILNKKNTSFENLKRGLINLLSGKNKNAKKDFNNAIKNDPENFVPLIFLKDIEDDKKIEEIINKMPVDLRKFYLIEYFYNKNSYENVVELGEELISDATFNNVRILEMIRDANLKLKNFDRAIEIQNKIGKDEKEMQKIYYLKAKSLNDEKIIDDLIKKFPKLTPAYILKFEKTGNVDILKDGYKKTKDSFFLYKLYEIYKEKEDEKVEKIIFKLDSEPIGKFFKALILYKKGNINDAKKIAENLIQNNDFKIIGSLLIAEINYRQEGELKESYEIMRKVLTIDNLELFNFICENCNKISSQWKDFCDECNEFNVLKLKWLK